jgi:predicted RNA-binding Zn-ribbon protein involved in translation (DUF1610 family)
MGVYITIRGEYACPQCGRKLADWQCKELEYDGYPVAILMQEYRLNKKMSGHMYNTCPNCGPVIGKIKKGRVEKTALVPAQAQEEVS